MNSNGNRDSLSNASHYIASRDLRLSKFFYIFPGGRPGAGLLLLRTAVGSIALMQGASYLNDAQGSPIEPRVLGSALLLAGTALIAGCFTHVASLIVALVALGTALRWPRVPLYGYLDSMVATILILVVAVAVFLLGPGAISIDARLFGLREIVISQTDGAPKDPN